MKEVDLNIIKGVELRRHLNEGNEREGKVKPDCQGPVLINGVLQAFPEKGKTKGGWEFEGVNVQAPSSSRYHVVIYWCVYQLQKIRISRGLG